MNNMEATDILLRREDLIGGEFAGEIYIRRHRIAMSAFEVAAPGKVPDHHRLHRACSMPRRGGMHQLMHVFA